MNRLWLSATQQHEKWKQHTKVLPPLRVGNHAYMQNLTGNHQQCWKRTGSVVEVKQHHQHVVKIDGSGRLTLRNHQHLRKLTPFRNVNRDKVIESFIPTACKLENPIAELNKPSEPTGVNTLPHDSLEAEAPNELEQPHSASPTSHNNPKNPSTSVSTHHRTTNTKKVRRP